ncbi:hypothetical protein LCGC14_1132080 [marine sediment metagenome]|uniref:Guanylate cyclase domain-containing protein n=1 Tax=marine sediment metagenome TaxID=412755 RepID=A0A0F9PJ14_9ZZZZ
MAEKGFKRKLTAIFSADVEGYERLMYEDEVGTIHIFLKQLRMLCVQFAAAVEEIKNDFLGEHFETLTYHY